MWPVNKVEIQIAKIGLWTANGPIRMHHGLGVHCGESISLSELISGRRGRESVRMCFMNIIYFIVQID